MDNNNPKMNLLRRTLISGLPKKVIRVAKKLKDPHQIPGTIQHDFVLESQGDPRQFLIGDYVAPPQKSRIIANSSQQTIQTSKQQNKHKILVSRSNRTLSNQISDHVSYEDNIKNYYQSLQEIQKNKQKLKNQRKQLKKKMRISQRLSFSRQNRSLKKFDRLEGYWNNMSDNISKITLRKPEDLAFNRGQKYRKKIQKQLTSQQQKVVNIEWKFTLRGQQNKTIALRNSDITAYLIDNDKTLTKNPVFVKKPDFRTLRGLCVKGRSKIKLEKEAAQSVGIENTRVDLLRRN